MVISPRPAANSYNDQFKLSKFEICKPNPHAALGDYVWADLNGDGRQSMSEPGVPGVRVNLQTCAGALLASTTTDTNGVYSFTGLQPGSYQITFVRPAGFDFTIPNVGSDALDSDADPVTGATACFTLTTGETNLTADAGLVLVPVTTNISLTRTPP